MRVELVTPCEHGDYDGHSPDEGETWCDGYSRSTVSGFSPEAVQAAAIAIHDYEDGPRTTDNLARAALAAAWAHDFGNPT